MKKWKLNLNILIALCVLAGILSGCQASTAPAAQSNTTEATTGAIAPEQKTFTLEELAKFNGKDGNLAYIAVDGNVYDVTDVPQWQNGAHAGKFEAGKDYTNELQNQAPHDNSKMQIAPIVGILSK